MPANQPQPKGHAGRLPRAAAGPLAGLVHLVEFGRRGPGGPPHICRGAIDSVDRPSAPSRLRFGAAAVALLLSLPLCAQDEVWFVEVAAPQSYVLCGRVLQLEARATSATGAPAEVGLQWRSSNPAIADVDQEGRVRGLLPGEAVIEAAHGDVRGRLVLQVQPARIRLDPADLDLETGQQTRFTAQALDADGAAIPGLRFVWTSGVPAVASVDGAGAVIGLAEGAVTVTALLDLPDLGVGFSAQARVRVRIRTPFRSARVVSSDSRTRPVTLRHIDSQSTAGDRSAFTAVLSNGSYALLLADNSGLRPLAVNGDFFEPTAQVITGFGSVTMNASGDVVAAVNVAPWPNMRLVRFPVAGPPESLEVPSDVVGWHQVGAHSLGPNGELLFLGWNDRGQNILYRRPDGRVDRVITQNDPVPGFGTANWFGELTAPVNGKAIFMGNGPTRNALLEWDGRAVRKLVATGDPILGRTVQWLADPILTSSGDVYLRIGGDNYNQIVRLSGSQWTNVVQSGQPLAGGVNLQWIDSFRDARGSTVVFSGGSDRGNGLFRYDGATFEIIARYGAANDEWRWVEYAALDSRGGVFARGTSGNIPTRLARVGTGSSPVVLAETGRALDLAAGAGLGWELLGGSNAGVPVFLSSTGGLVRAEAGRADPVLVHGDSLPEGETLFWTAAFAANRSGEFAFRAGSPRGEAIYLWRNGRLTRLIQNWDGARAPTGGNIRWFDWTLAVNTRGQVVVYTHYDGGDGLLLFAEGAAPQTIAIEGSPAPGGGVLRGLGPAVIDDRGRVAFFAGTGSGSPVLFYWENGRVRRLRQVGDNGITNFDTWRFQAAGDQIYVFTRFSNAQEISAYDGASWRPAVTESPSGICSTWFSAASNGEVLYSACLPDGGQGLVVRKPDGRDVPVAATGRRSADGDWFFQFLSSVLSEQGDVFFAAVTPAGPQDRVTLFRATPQ